MGWRVRSAFAALCLFWGLPYFFIKLALRDISPLAVAWSRLALGALILLPIAWHRGSLRALRRHWGAVCAFGLIEFAGPFWLIPLGERWISSSVTAILLAAVPLVMAPQSRLLGVYERLGPRRVLGLAIGFVGVVTLVGVGSISGALGWVGVGCVLAATVGLSAGPLIAQRHLGGVDPVGSLAASLAIATLVQTPFALLSLPSRLPSALTLASIAVLGVVCTALAMLLFFYLIGRVGALRASVVTYVNPGVAAIVGVALLHEDLGIAGISGLVLILTGSWLATHTPAAATARTSVSA